MKIRSEITVKYVVEYNDDQPVRLIEDYLTNVEDLDVSSGETDEDYVEFAFIGNAELIESRTL